MIYLTGVLAAAGWALVLMLWWLLSKSNKENQDNITRAIETEIKLAREQAKCKAEQERAGEATERHRILIDDLRQTAKIVSPELRVARLDRALARLGAK